MGLPLWNPPSGTLMQSVDDSALGMIQPESQEYVNVSELRAVRYPYRSASDIHNSYRSASNIHNSYRSASNINNPYRPHGGIDNPIPVDRDSDNDEGLGVTRTRENPGAPNMNAEAVMNDHLQQQARQNEQIRREAASRGASIMQETHEAILRLRDSDSNNDEEFSFTFPRDNPGTPNVDTELNLQQQQSEYQEELRASRSATIWGQLQEIMEDRPQHEDRPASYITPEREDWIEQGVRDRQRQREQRVQEQEEGQLEHRPTASTGHNGIPRPETTPPASFASRNHRRQPEQRFQELEQGRQHQPRPSTVQAIGHREFELPAGWFERDREAEDQNAPHSTTRHFILRDSEAEKRHQQHLDELETLFENDRDIINAVPESRWEEEPDRLALDDMTRRYNNGVIIPPELTRGPQFF
jgi:hypothetical protein